MLIVPSSDLIATCELLVQLLRLRQTNRGSKIGHSIVVSNHRKPVTTVCVLSLISQLTRMVGNVSTVRCEHPALARSDHFVTEEAKCCSITNTANSSILIVSTMRFSSIFKQE